MYPVYIRIALLAAAGVLEGLLYYFLAYLGLEKGEPLILILTIFAGGWFWGIAFKLCFRCIVKPQSGQKVHFQL